MSLSLIFTDEFHELEACNTCAVCKKIYVDPKVLTTCNHVICNKCINFKRLYCPLCEIPFTKRDIEEDAFSKSVCDSIRSVETLFKTSKYNCYEVDNIPIKELKNMLMVEAPKTVDDIDVTDDKDSMHNDDICRIENSVVKFVSCMKKNPKGETQLHTACRQGKYDKVNDFIQQNVDLNVGDNACWAPIHEAVQSGNYDCVELLLKSGALVNIPGEFYTTPLHQAVQLKYSYVTELLLKYGAKTNLKDYKGNTPLDLCSSKEMDAFLKTTKKECIMPSFYYNKELIFYLSKVNEKTMKMIKNDTVKIRTASQQVYFNKNCVSTLVIGENESTYSMPILIAIINGVFIIKENNLSRYIFKKIPLQFNLIPTNLEIIENSILNRLKCYPKLFDGISFHILDYKPVKIDGIEFTKDSLSKLITTGNGKVLKRAQTETTTKETYFPFHAQKSKIINRCSNYIIYNEDQKPLLMYNMIELKHRPINWLLECILKFQILDWNNAK